MTVEFRLPDLGEGMEEAEVVAWMVEPGAPVALDQPLVEVETDKAVVVIPSPVSGTLAGQHAVAGERVPVGAVLATFTETGADLTEAEGDATREPSPSASPPAPSAGPAGTGKARATPAVRRRARERGLDLARIVGTGPGGRVTDDDLDRAAAEGAEPPSPPAGPLSVASATPGRTVALCGIPRRTAQVMAESWASIPHMTGMDEIDATALLATVERARARIGEDDPPVTLLAYFLVAVAQSLREVPAVNASVDMEREEVTYHEGCHVGFAVATPGGLVVPVVRDADRRGIRSLSAEIAGLTERARAGTMAPAELRGGTFTVTNFGTLGGSRFATPIIRPPEVAMIGFGAVRVRPWVVEDRVEPRPLLPYSFSADHRVINGDTASRFTRAVIARLGDPTSMLLGV